MKSLSLDLFLALVCSVAASAASPHHRAVVKEYERVFTTYPYSDPDPVPNMSRFYPYFRYDGFTDTPSQEKWKVVELSNDYLQVLILPQIGGKIWATIEKSSGKSFIYFNHVVKFRDVSMRGPWTSGGLEPNYGIMGHTPNCFTPVDYLARQNADGSASCFIGVLDLLTRTTWQLEIRLAAGEACFSTRSLWHNGSGLEQPYYTWMNVGIKADGELQFINPGTQYLGHDGKVFDWPINPQNGRNISWYERNNFGSYKSYHVFGLPAEFFGGYWHDEDFGMARCSDYGDKPGRKIWIWGLSREGMIWEKLLTDTDGQYVEVQSGRLFNQADETSSLTPFKHKEFSPYATDTWTEYWEPVKGTKGFVAASPWGALNVSRESDDWVIRISPARALRDKLQVYDGKRLVWQQDVNLEPMRPFETRVKCTQKSELPMVSIGGDKLRYGAGDDEVLSRPRTSPSNFDWNSVFGLYLKGKESMRQRAYSRAVTELQSCLNKDPNFAPALVGMASLENRRGHWLEAVDWARRALSIDTYEPEANYQFGLASAALAKAVDAREAFSIAALSMSWRNAASVELSKAWLREGRYERALRCAEESLEGNGRNLDALQLMACIHRLQSNAAKAQAALDQLLELEPLSHFARFEKYLEGKIRRDAFTSMIRSELPHESFLELAAWYHGIGRDEEAAKVLELAPSTAEVLYWLAYLRQDTNVLSRAETASPAFVFPFRTESVPVLEWAERMSPSWEPRYFLGLIRWHQGDLVQARELFSACRDQPRFGPFYAARAQVCPEGAIKDLEKAERLEPGQWRYGAMLTRHYLAEGNAPAGLRIAEECARRFPTNNVVAVLYAKCLAANDRYEELAQLLASLNLLPCEGSTEAHSLYRDAHLMLAAARLNEHAYAAAMDQVARARSWPEHLGAGKPYAEDVDQRLEDWVEYTCQRRAHLDEARETLNRILVFSPHSRQRGVTEIVHALALKQSGKKREGRELLDNWLKEEPSNELPQWGKELFASEWAPLPPSLQEGDCRVLAETLR